MSYRDIVRAQIRADEGVSPLAYVDTVGKVTVGVGHNLSDKPLRPEVIDLILEHDLEDAERDARHLLPSFDSLSDARKAVVVNMAFNLGQRRLAAFHKFLDAVEEGRWEDAKREMLDSHWALQVHARADRLAEAMVVG